MGVNANIFGVDQVVTCYDNRQVDVWAIFQGKQFLQAGNDADELRAFLKMIEGTTPVYTLRLFPDYDTSDQVTSKSEDRGSINFKLPAKDNPAAVSGYVPYGGPRSPMEQVMAKISERIASKVADEFENAMDEGEQPEPRSLGDVVAGYLEEPAKLIPVITMVEGMIGRLMNRGAVPMHNYQQAPAAVGSIPQAQAQAPGKTDPDLVEKNRDALVSAIDRLGRVDPDIVNTLVKLADLAERDPGMYQAAKGFLK